jgi:hypothetical protein
MSESSDVFAGVISSVDSVREDSDVGDEWLDKLLLCGMVVGVIGVTVSARERETKRPATRG